MLRGAVRMTTHRAGDVIFNAGEIPTHPLMFFVSSGTLQYFSISGQETRAARSAVRIERGALGDIRSLSPKRRVGAAPCDMRRSSPKLHSNWFR